VFPDLASGAQPGTYLSVGVFSISLANLLIIVVMLVVFVLAILLPYPGHDEGASPSQESLQRPAATSGDGS